ncbi:MAG: hypothetical protein Q9174_003888 [Haloplaca sp. 1 TL-2023]
MSSLPRSTSLGTGLEDPFISNSGNGQSLAGRQHRRVPSEEGEILSDEEDNKPGNNQSSAVRKHRRVPSEDGEIFSDEENARSSAQPKAVFGTAPVQSKVSSAVKLPAAPSSQNSSAPLAMPQVHQEMHRQRVLSNNMSVLSAVAAPFVPNAIAQGNDGGTNVEVDKRTDCRLCSVKDGISSLLGISNQPADEPSQTGKKTGGELPWTTKQKQDSPSQSGSGFPCQADQNTMGTENFYTPSSSSTDRVLHTAQENRRNAFSDETNLYNRRAVVQHLYPGNPQGMLDCTGIRPPRGFAGQRPPQISKFRASSQNAPYSLPQLPSQFSCYVSTPSNYKPHFFDGSDDSLDHLKQGPFHAGQNGDSNQSSMFDHYTPTPAIPHNHVSNQSQINPYAHDGNTMGSGNYFTGSSNYPQQLQHHLYAALPPHRELGQPNQRTAKDFFISEDLRQTLQRKSEASLMTIPSYRVNDTSSEHAIRNIQSNWKRVRNANVVSVHLAFTNSGFGDSSLIFVTDFHPMAETLAQKHFTGPPKYGNRYSTTGVSEQNLWAYIVQIANALKSIHNAGLAARVLDPSKILFTSQGHIRLNACAILDVVQSDKHQVLADLQRTDLQLFGKLIVALGSSTMSQHNQSRAMESFNRSYSPRLKEITTWLLEQTSTNRNDGIDKFLTLIASDITTAFDSSLHHDDFLQSTLMGELENARILRLITKMNHINERPEYEHDQQWAEWGKCYPIKLFRDYVYHQVDAQGKPHLDLAHVLSCLNKLDAGSDEKITLSSRDEETVIVVTYKEVKTAIETAFNDLSRR